jgi:hypothetical protein
LTGLENPPFEDHLATATITMAGNTKIPVLEINQLIANKKALAGQMNSLYVLALDEIQRLRSSEM